jgi:uncharacterized cupin superfamily protein
VRPVEEAKLVDTESGKEVEGEGWFVLNVGEAVWERNRHAGTWSKLEPDEARFDGFGAGVHVLEPGQANGRYHAESVQEGFLVLSGECVALVEGEERPMRQWDYLHCPPGTHHILVGAGDGPCAIFMIGVRSPDATIHYEVNELASKYDASPPHDTGKPREAYADQDRTITRDRAPWPWCG